MRRLIVRLAQISALVSVLFVSACSDSSGASEDGSSGSSPGEPDSGGPTCGGPGQPGCTPDGTSCTGPADCAGGDCVSGVCQKATNTDGRKNGDESDVDCGGSSTGAERCDVGKRCNASTDCKEKVCVNGTCVAPTSDDQEQNGTETDVDCGGPGVDVPRCGPNAKCAAATDCRDKICAGGTCAQPKGDDGVQNGDESDVDCGGTTTGAPRCSTDAHCASGTDCKDKICKDGTCAAPRGDDNVQNGDESDVDCGGSMPGVRRCRHQDNEHCVTGADCNEKVCGANGICAAPRGDDNVQNGDESDVDCGGTMLGVRRCRYQDNERCMTGTDCNEKVCGVNKVCAAPSYTDGVQNGNETDLDCGGDGLPAHACGAGKLCSAAAVDPLDDTKNSNCTSGACDTTGRCAEAPSCKPHFGGDSCGRGEVLVNGGLEAGAVHESCCRSIPLNAESRLDKYEITSGRMREFVRRTGMNVAAWWNDNRAALRDKLPKTGNPPAPVTCASLGANQWNYAYCQLEPMADFLPSSLFAPTRTFSRCSNDNGTGCSQQSIDMGIYRHIGNTTVFPDRPCPNCGQGCWLGTGQYDAGHPTYWGDAAWQNNGGSAARKFSQEQLDVKPLNCVTQVMLAAFCAWDGGRLPTGDELGTQAWGPSTWPWGASPGVRDVMPGAPEVTQFRRPDGTLLTEKLVQMTRDVGTYNPNAPLFNVTNWKPEQDVGMPTVRYTWPLIAANAWGQQDMAYLIAAPGRMVNDVRRGYTNPETNLEEGWHDLAANIMEATGDHRSNDDGNHGGFPRVRWVGGSFEVHSPQRLGYEGNGNVLTKYGKMGGRCIRPR